MSVLAQESSPPLRVRLWERQTGTVWKRVGELQTWEAATVEPRYLHPGLWDMTLPWGQQAAKLKRSQLVTFDLQRNDAWMRVLTGRPRTLSFSTNERGRIVLKATGDGALGILGGVLIWPAPTLALGAQDVVRYRDEGPVETVLRSVIVAQAITRLGISFDIAASQGRGGTVRLRERMSNLLEVTTRKALNGGIGVRMGLVDNADSDMLARLRLEFFMPTDRSARVKLSHSAGSLQSWEHVATAPEATRAILMGEGEGTARKYRQAANAAQETQWGWPAEAPVEGRANDEELTLAEQAAEALTELLAKDSFALEAIEARGQMLGQHFNLGDTIGVSLAPGIPPANEVLRGYTVTAAGGRVSVKLGLGNPDGMAPLFKLEAIIKSLKAQLRALQREE